MPLYEGFRLSNDMMRPCDWELSPIVGVGLPNPYACLKNLAKTLFSRKLSNIQPQRGNIFRAVKQDLLEILGTFLCHSHSPSHF